MTLEISLPTNAVNANSSNAFGRKPGRAALVDTDFSAEVVGFGAVLARVDDSTPAMEVSEGTKYRRSKSHEVNSIPDVPAPFAINQEASDPSAKGGALETTSATKLAIDRLSLTSDEEFGNDAVVQVVPTDGAIGLSAPKFAAGSMPALDSDIANTVFQSDIGAYEEFVESALKGVQEPAHEASKALGRSEIPIAVNSELFATNLSGSLASAKTKLGKVKLSDEPQRSNGDVSTTGAAVRPDEGSVRDRILQEIKLLTQQASLSREVVDLKQQLGVEFGLPKYGKAAADLSLTALEPRVDASGQGAELSTTTEIGASAPLDGFLATTADLETPGAYWISADLKNAKMKLGDPADGGVEVSIHLHGNQAQVAFKADEALTRNALQDSGSALREMLRRDGIELSGVSVGTSGAGGGGGGGRQSAGSENTRSTQRKAVSTNLESPKLTSLNSGVQTLDLFV